MSSIEHRVAKLETLVVQLQRRVDELEGGVAKEKHANEKTVFVLPAELYDELHWIVDAQRRSRVAFSALLEPFSRYEGADQ